MHFKFTLELLMIYDDYEKDKDLKTGLASVFIQCD
jgi:hypothetical protein